MIENLIAIHSDYENYLEVCKNTKKNRKKELTKFWPLINEKCIEIKNKKLSSIFISNSLAQYIINDKVNKKRNLEGYFQDITSTNRNIANSISNLNTNIVF